MRAMILAAGRGERMRPLTDKTPKPLLQVRGKPLIAWHIERLVAAGIPDIIINHAWLGEQIERTLGDGSAYGACLAYSAEAQPLETAGGIARALEFFENETFVVINGDIWCDWDPAGAASLASSLRDRAALACLVLVDNPAHHPSGDFVLAPHGQVREAHVRSGHPTLTFSGIGVYHPALFDDMAKGMPAPLAPLLRRAISEHKVIGVHHTGQWVDVGTPERLAKLQYRESVQSVPPTTASSSTTSATSGTPPTTMPPPTSSAG
jgi:MurNAc alpha-1-phosphate uridylyltransferase